MPDFLSEADVALLREIAASSCAWAGGRQGTGYEVLSLKNDERVEQLRERCQFVLGVDVTDIFWDCFLVRYPEGAFIPPHRDAAALFGRRHQRLNAVVTPATAGGVLTVGGDVVELPLRAALVFYPDEEEHSVSPVTGERLLWSMGHWLQVAGAARHRPRRDFIRDYASTFDGQEVLTERDMNDGFCAIRADPLPLRALARCRGM